MTFDNLESVPEPQSRGWHLPLSWSLLFVAGWLLYELTTQPALAIVTICLKFGWSDFHTAIWLRRVDPIRARRRAFFWMHLGAGFWKTAVTALVPMFATPILMDALGQAFRAKAGPPAHFMGAFLTALGGFLLSALTTAVAVVSAWRHRVPLWLNRAIHRDRRENIWPPLYALTAQSNNLGRLLLAMLTVFVFAVFSTVLIWLAITMQGPAAPGRANKGDPLFGGVLFAGLIAAGITIVGGRELLLRKIAAKEPSACWPDAFLSQEEADAAAADSYEY